MDEEIIQRIVYLILATILLIVFSTKKKKPDKKATSIPSQQQQSEASPQKEIIIFEDLPIEQNKQNSKAKSEESIEKIVTDEIFEDETKIEHRVIKKKTYFDEQSQKNDEKSIEITTTDLKKAVILSDIIQPKYF